MPIANPIRERLRQGDIAVGFGVSHSRLTTVAELARICGFHWLFIDTEHSQFNAETTMQLSVAALSAGIPPIVRVLSGESFHIGPALDGGASGIIIPHVDTAEAAAACVRNSRFGPEGSRSMPGLMPQLGFRSVPLSEAVEKLNGYILVVVMLETPEAISNAEEIAAVEGVDVLLIGSADLSCAMGIPGQFDHADMVAAYEKVIAAARSHGKWPGMGGIYHEGTMRRFIELGARFVLGGSDVSFMTAAAARRSEFLAEIPLKISAAAE